MKFNVQVSSLIWNNLGLGSKIGPMIAMLGVMGPLKLKTMDFEVSC
jgi:hypothetical protein